MKSHRKWLRRIVWMAIIGFIGMNMIAVFHAYRFTHFSETDEPKTSDGRKLSTAGKIGALLFGINNPRPENDTVPSQYFETITIQSNRAIEGWYIPGNDSIGTVALFHGYSADKASMLDKAEVFLGMGYNVLLVDFMGSGGSEGNQTTIGYLEAEQVKSCMNYLTERGEQRIFLFGTSMGAAAVMKAVSESTIQPTAIIIECPFGTMYETVCARFRTMGAPEFPMAGLLVFWGGTINGFNAFGHNPADYARGIKAPVLLMYGAKDEKVSKAEIDTIYHRLPGLKKCIVYPEAGHENYLTKYKEAWTADITHFIREIQR